MIFYENQTLRQPLPGRKLGGGIDEARRYVEAITRNRSLFNEDRQIRAVFDLADNGRLDDPESRNQALELVETLSRVLI